MRVTAAGVLCYWPPHDGVIYCIAGPVSRNVPVEVVGSLRDLDRVKECVVKHRPWLLAASESGMASRLAWNDAEPDITYRLKLAPSYAVTFRVSNVRRHSVAIPEAWCVARARE